MINIKIIKFCGIKSRQDIDFCNQTKPTHVGFVFAKESKRYIAPEELFVFLKKLSGSIKKVGVFVNSEEFDIVSTVTLLKLDVVQLHGDEDCAFVEALEKSLARHNLSNVEIWRAVKVTEENMQKLSCLTADKLLFDGTTPGSGDVSNWELIKKYRSEKPFILAGGLNIDNIETAISDINPMGIDLSSGIETDGVKDIETMKKIMEILK
jgi:phosphoribosylanthranilate isomerase